MLLSFYHALTTCSCAPMAQTLSNGVTGRWARDAATRMCVSATANVTVMASAWVKTTGMSARRSVNAAAPPASVSRQRAALPATGNVDAALVESAMQSDKPTPPHSASIVSCKKIQVPGRTKRTDSIAMTITYAPTQIDVLEVDARVQHINVVSGKRTCA